MEDFGDGIGTAVSGGLLARILDPDSGAQGKHPHQPDNCLNCNTPLEGAYCHACGQPGHIHRTIGGFLHDLLHGAFHFEGKFWRTLPLLVLRPGKLTRQYIEGKRARFVSPMALFLFSVFLMFAVFQVLGIKPPADFGSPVEISEGEDLPSPPADDIEAADVGPISDFRRGLRDGLAGDGTPEPAREADSTTGVTFLDNMIAKWESNPGLMAYKMQANSYKFSWLLIPISVPFVWLLFAWKRRFKAYDHAIFVTYSLSFMTLLFVIVSLLGAVGTAETILLIIVALAPPIHLYKQLRGTYQLSRFSASWRLLALSAFIWIVIVLFVQALLVLGAF